MNTAILESLSTFSNFALYLLLGIVLTLVFVTVYLRVTPYHELKLIKAGNISAAISLSGSILGFIFPIASVITHSVNLVDLVIWACIAFVVQSVAYFIVSILLKDFAKGIAEDKASYAIFLATISVAFGLINAVCMIP